MPIIKPKQKSQKTQQRISIDETVLEEIKQYCEYANFAKIDEFFEEASIHILAKDKEFKEWKDSVSVEQELQHKNFEEVAN